MKITKESLIIEVLNANEKAAEILFKEGLLSCVGCPMAQIETIEQACLAHGMQKKEINDLIRRLNKN